MNIRWPVYYGYRNKKVVWFTLEITKIYFYVYPDSSVFYDMEFEINPTIKEISESKNIEEEVLYEEVLVGIEELINIQIDDHLKRRYRNVCLN